MTIDLDKVWELVKPRPLTLRIDFRDYPVRRLTIADAKVIAELSERTDQQLRDWLAGMFEGEPPRCVALLGDQMDEDHRAANKVQVLTIVDALGLYYMEELGTGKKLDAVHAELERLMRGTASSNGSC